VADFLSQEQKLEMQYDALMKRALGNERRNFFREQARRAEHQMLFSEMGSDWADSIADGSAAEAFELIDSGFAVLQYTVPVRNAPLYDALAKLGEQTREIVLMAFGLNMSESEIADETGIERRTVNRIKAKACKELKKILEEQGYDASIFFPKSSKK
jgi:RNA polymerase sigma factor (sigma-70 family)